MRDYTNSEVVLIVGAVLVAGALIAWVTVYAFQTYALIGTMMSR